MAIHYHGTPLSPRRWLLKMEGKHFCVSFAYPLDIDVCLRIGQSVMLDNGAFSAKTKGLVFDKNKFYQWIEPYLAHPNWAVIPDVIDGTVEQQREMVKTWPFRKNLGLPVWHLGLPVDYLFELCDQFDRVCFGSSAEYWQIGSEKWCRRMDEAFNALVKRFGSQLPWVHGLRMMDKLSGPWPLASADSVNVARNFKDRKQCPDCMALRIDSINPPLSWEERPIQGSLC
jgi:hypothetical protein